MTAPAADLVRWWRDSADFARQHGYKDDAKKADMTADMIASLQAEVDELRSERKWMGKVIDERDDKIRQLRLIANVNGDWNIKYGEAINRAEAAEAELAALKQREYLVDAPPGVKDTSEPLI